MGYQRVYPSPPAARTDVLAEVRYRRRGADPGRLARPEHGRARLRHVLPQRDGRARPFALLADQRRPGARAGCGTAGRASCRPAAAVVRGPGTGGRRAHEAHRRAGTGPLPVGAVHRAATGCGTARSPGCGASSGTATSPASARRCWRRGPRRCPSTRAATSRRWCTPPSATPGRSTGCPRWPAPPRSAPARRTWSPARPWPPSTGCRCCCSPATSSRPGRADPVLQQLEVPWAYDVSVNDALRPGVPLLRPDLAARDAAGLAARRRCGCSPTRWTPARSRSRCRRTCRPRRYDWPDELFRERVWHVRRPRARRGRAGRGRRAAAVGAAPADRGRRRGAARGSGAGAARSSPPRPVSRWRRRRPARGRCAGTTRRRWARSAHTGTAPADAAAREADVVLGVGTRWTDFTTASGSLFAPGRALREPQRRPLRRPQDVGPGRWWATPGPGWPRWPPSWRASARRSGRTPSPSGGR